MVIIEYNFYFDSYKRNIFLKVKLVFFKRKELTHHYLHQLCKRIIYQN